MKSKKVKMKRTDILVLVVGVIGIISSVTNMILQKEIATEITGFICGLSLIVGYFQLKNKTAETC